MQISKRVTKGNGITIPCMLHQEVGTPPGVLMDVTVDTAGIHIVEYVPTCRFCGAMENAAAVCGMEVCRICVGKIVEVFQ